MKVPDEIKPLIIEKCPLAYRYYLDKMIFDSEAKLDEKLQELMVTEMDIETMPFVTKFIMCIAKDENERMFFGKFTELDLRLLQTYSFLKILQKKTESQQRERQCICKTKAQRCKFGRRRRGIISYQIKKKISKR